MATIAQQVMGLVRTVGYRKKVLRSDASDGFAYLVVLERPLERTRC
jgi:hypothetical protein